MTEIDEECYGGRHCGPGRTDLRIGLRRHRLMGCSE